MKKPLLSKPSLYRLTKLTDGRGGETLVAEIDTTI